jgi:negative regulator of replication initiation
MINLKQALTDHASVFLTPEGVLLNLELTREQKIGILKNWLSDVREILVAEEENMQGKDCIKTFEAILSALHALDAKLDMEHTPPTKQGG